MVEPLVHALLHLYALLLQVCDLFVQGVLDRALASPVGDRREVALILTTSQVWT